MLIDKLKDWQYYYKKLPLYIRNSYGVSEHFKMIYEIMMQIETVENDVCNAFNILQQDYIDNIIAKYDDVDSYNFSILDLIADIFGINRVLNVSYLDTTNTKITKSLKLTNKELYLFIKSRIIQNNYDGSFIQAKQYYDEIGLPVYISTGTTSGHCEMYLSTNNNVTDNVRQLFLANLLTLKSVGIKYILFETDISLIGIWSSLKDIAISNNSWNVAKWS